MRRSSVAIVVLCLSVLAPATAHAYVGAPITHGPDPAQVAAGPEAAAAPAALGKRVAKLVPSAWCGTEAGSDDTVNEVDNGPYRYHAVYMIAADGTDRFGALASGMQRDAFQASALLETAYGRAIRFDIGTSCGPQYLDISVVRMPQTSAQLTAAARSGNGTFNAVSAALDAAGFTTIQPTDSLADAAARTRNYVVWLDAPAPSGSCGQAAIYDDPTRSADNLNNFGGKAAVVFRNGSGFCSSNAARHEIGHNLGGLQPVAPHAFDGSHCDDAYEDTMCYSNSPEVADGERGTFFDYGNDDYWSLPGAPLPWWTVDENRFLCPDAACNVVAGRGVLRRAPDGRAGGRRAQRAPPAKGHRPARPAGAARGRGRAAWRRAGPVVPRARGAAQVRVRPRCGPRGCWRPTAGARGSARGVLVPRRRRHCAAEVRTAVRRATRRPRTLRVRVRCRASRPRARV